MKHKEPLYYNFQYFSGSMQIKKLTYNNAYEFGWCCGYYNIILQPNWIIKDWLGHTPVYHSEAYIQLIQSQLTIGYNDGLKFKNNNNGNIKVCL